MSKQKTKKKPQQNRRREDGGKRAFDIILSLMLAGGVGYFVYDAVRQSGKIDQTTTYTTQQTTEDTTESETVEEGKVIFTNQEFQNSDIHTGSLILVNNSTEYKGDDSDIVSLYEVKLAAECHSFSVRDGELMVRQEELKTLPFGDVWAEYCRVCGAPADGEWFAIVEAYERDVQSKRG